MKRLILALILATTGALAQSVDDVAAGGGGGSGTIGTGAVNDIVCYTDATTVGPCDTAGFIWNAGKLTVSGSGTGVIGMLEGTAPGAGSTSGEHNMYFDSSDGRLYTHNNGGSALPIGYVLTHATDCTSVTVQGTGVNLKEGDICHESDADALYSYDGAAWDLVGGAGGVGRSLFKVVWGVNQAGGGFSSLPSTIGCRFDSTVTTTSGTGLDLNGAPFMNASGNEGFDCRGWVIPSGVDLTALTFSVWGTEFVNNTNTWDVELYVQCLANGETLGAWSTEHAAVTLTAASGTTGTFLAGTDTTVDISAACNTGEIMLPRVQIGAGGTSTDDLVVMAVEIFEQ